MTAIPLGQGAYKRLYSGAPEVKLLNRWLEANPANPREGTSILARPGTTPITALTPGPIRGTAYLPGVFNDVLWVVSGNSLYYIGQDQSVNLVTSSLIGSNTPEFTWQVGAGYSRIWLQDGGVLYYSGPATQASSILSTDQTVTPPNVGDTIRIGSYYYRYTFSTPITSGAGTSSNPWLVYVGSAMNQATENLYEAINYINPSFGHYSPGITAPNPEVSISAPILSSDDTYWVMTITANLAGTSGNSLVTQVISGTRLSFTGATLAGGANIVFNTCAIPGGVAANSLTEVSGYVLVSVLNTQQFYWVNPGDTTIDSLNFANKESGPDPIVKMRTVGDQVLIMGTRSTENWYATGNSLTPFAPIQGRVYARGVVDNTPVIINDGIIIVGDDGRVYNIGFQAGDSSDSPWGVTRISNNGIEERIRRQLRRENGLTP